MKPKKKDKKLQEQRINELQDKCDKLERKQRKLMQDRSDILADRDKYQQHAQSLEKAIREISENEENTLRQQLNDTKNELKKLKKEHDRLQAAKDKLDDEYDNLQQKYEIEKDVFKKTMQKHQLKSIEQIGDINIKDDDRIALRNLRNELTQKFEKQLRDREAQWIKSKNDSIKTLDKEYAELKLAMSSNIGRLEKTNKDLKNSLKNKEDEIRRLKKENNKIDKLTKEKHDLEEEINRKAAEIMKLKTELSKYKILWSHFFGLDAPLKDEIEKVNNKLDKFENRYSIQSPIPKKRRRIIIESLQQWNKRGQPPLRLDGIPQPNDIYQRFELYNINDKVIELKGFFLVNQHGIKIPIDSRQISPGHSIGIALRKKKNRFDILYDKNKYQGREFCKFTDGEIFYLEDAFQEREQLFPITELIYDNLRFFGINDPPIELHQILNENDEYRAIELINTKPNKIKFKGMKFTNKSGTWTKRIPFKSLPKKGIIRLVITTNIHHHKIRNNDLVVDRTSLPKTDLAHECLMLQDRNGNTIELYNMDRDNIIDITGGVGSGNNGDGMKREREKNECFIM